MNDLSPTRLVLANGARGPTKPNNALQLHYIKGYPGQNVRIGLPRFVRNVNHLPPRVLDLLEIASYVFAADRCVSRGPKTAVEYHAWSRSFEFHIRVRDYEFWSRPDVGLALSETLTFMTGDAEFNFNFEPGHSTEPTSLFDRPDFTVTAGEEGVLVSLFSGGLDSLSGVLDLLTKGEHKVILVSHQSQAGTIKTQRNLIEALHRKYPDRLLHYKFECTLRGTRAREESQRTRSFLYTSIAYAIASAYSKEAFQVYENGVTSINFRRREDLANARASRTTHPQSIGKIANLFSLIGDTRFSIELPYLWLTKADVIAKLKKQSPDLISSAVSCSRTFQTQGIASHCGLCFQCVDRRIASHAVECEKYDHRGLYTFDVISDSVDDREARTTLLDYVRQAISLSNNSADKFEDEYLVEVAELLDYIEGDENLSDAEKVQKLWQLLQRHGKQVKQSLIRMRDLYEDLSLPVPTNSLLGIVSAREYLKPEPRRLADNIAEVIIPALGDMFASEKPKNEPDLNAKLGALLRTHEGSLQSEHPCTSFACAQVIPDHLIPDVDVLIETKYIRKATSPSQANEGIAADLTKYPQGSFILFVVYDPLHRIPSDNLFKNEIEAKGRNCVLIVR
ncbi:hypothetical protein OAC89_03085 [Deltaproteobacteria bacterium]|nr:hypothetical protein [Deltaproteobacteria bacterium]